MQYQFNKIEKKWQKYWADNESYKAEIDPSKPKFYALDMFPYPSGAGLHVGHPLGYIASDIYARYKRLKGFNGLHPMGYDSFGLPAEQYAIQTGQHPAQTTKENIARYRQQLDQIGFSFDWDREVRTSDPSYYKWTQWIFIQLFNSWYNKKTDKAEKIDTLIAEFEKNGNAMVDAACDPTPVFSAEHWKKMPEEEQQTILLNYRLTFLSEAMVNWCPALGTVLANDEVIGGVSERGGHPVIQKKMTQWSMRITAFAQRLLDGLDVIDWPESLRESQRNWIGRSEGSSINFKIIDSDELIEVFTTRPDTVFGVSFLTLAPEHSLVSIITTPDRSEAVSEYLTRTTNRSERERQADGENQGHCHRQRHRARHVWRDRGLGQHRRIQDAHVVGLEVRSQGGLPLAAAQLVGELDEALEVLAHLRVLAREIVHLVVRVETARVGEQPQDRARQRLLLSAEARRALSEPGAVRVLPEDRHGARRERLEPRHRLAKAIDVPALGSEPGALDDDGDVVGLLRDHVLEQPPHDLPVRAPDPHRGGAPRLGRRQAARVLVQLFLGNQPVATAGVTCVGARPVLLAGNVFVDGIGVAV